MGIIRIYFKKNEGFNLALPDLTMDGDYDIGFEDKATVVFSNIYKQSETVFVGPTSDVVITKEETNKH